jgi:hypothetical protein
LQFLGIQFSVFSFQWALADLHLDPNFRLLDYTLSLKTEN